jgi:hypothetical protein
LQIFTWFQTKEPKILNLWIVTTSSHSKSLWSIDLSIDSSSSEITDRQWPDRDLSFYSHTIDWSVSWLTWDRRFHAK